MRIPPALLLEVSDAIEGFLDVGIVPDRIAVNDDGSVGLYLFGSEVDGAGAHVRVARIGFDIGEGGHEATITLTDRRAGDQSAHDAGVTFECKVAQDIAIRAMLRFVEQGTPWKGFK